MSGKRFFATSLTARRCTSVEGVSFEGLEPLDSRGLGSKPRRWRTNMAKPFAPGTVEAAISLTRKE